MQIGKNATGKMAHGHVWGAEVDAFRMRNAQLQLNVVSMSVHDRVCKNCVYFIHKHMLCILILKRKESYCDELCALLYKSYCIIMPDAQKLSKIK